MSEFTIPFSNNHSGKFRETINEIAEQICKQYMINNKSLAEEVLGFNSESSLRSLKERERKGGLKIDTVKTCYILFLLKDKKSHEKYLEFFENPEQVKHIVENINIKDYEEKLLKFAYPKNNYSTSLTENTQPADTLSDTPDESILQTADNQNTGKESVTTTQEPPIINNFKNYLKDVLGNKYELTIEQIKYAQYFILKCTNKKNNKFKTIVVIALKQILDTFEPDLPEIDNYEIYEEEIEIIKETLNNADYFWFFHHEKTSQEKFDAYIADVPELSSKTLIETVTIDNNTYILHCRDTSKFIKKLKQDDRVEEGDLQLNGLLLFEFPTSDQ